MSTDPNVTPQPTANPSIPLTPYQQTAAGVIGELDKITAVIPNLASGIPPAVSKFVRGHLNVPNAFLATAHAAVEQTEALQGTGMFDLAASREILQYLEAFKPVAERIYALGDVLAYTLWTKKATGASSSFRIYGMSKQIALMGGNAAAESHVSNMKRDLGRKGGRKPKDKPATTPTTPPTTPTTGGAS